VVDISKVAFWNKSQVIFVLVPAVESRYRSVILESDGVAPRWLECIPEAKRYTSLRTFGLQR
jgi:hypothetical protein